MRKAKFAENKVRVLSEEVASERPTSSLPDVGGDGRRKVMIRGRITSKVNACGVAKCSQQTVRNRSLCTGRF